MGQLRPDDGTRWIGRRAAGCVARGAVVALTAGLVVGGDAGTAQALGYGGVGGTFARPTAERAAAAQTARLDGAAAQAAQARRTEVLAVAEAARSAAVAVEPLAAGLADVAVRDGLRRATERLGALQAAAGAPDVPLPATAPVPLAPAARPADPLAEAELTRAVHDTAGEVFRLAMRVETLSGAVTLDETVVRVAAVTRLETAVTAAGAVAAEVGTLAPLTPLTEEERALRDAEAAAAAAASLEPAGDDEGTVVRTGSGPRLRVGTPVGVVADVERWQNGQVPADELCPVPFAPDHLLQCDAAAALGDLNAAYREEWGTDLDVVSSYRELATQVELRATKGGLAAVPGTSNHGWGIAVDLGGIGGLGEFDRPGYVWLQRHAAAYGWYHPEAMEPGGGGPQEPWHWEFGTA